MVMSLWETDLGTKDRAINAVNRIQGKKGKEFRKALRFYSKRVLNRARDFCILHGAIDTGTLYRSIRKISREQIPTGSFVAGRDLLLDYLIIAGGPPFINPKTGKFVDYAQAVHDGTAQMPPRPFLTDAMDAEKATFDALTDNYMKWIEDEWRKG